VTEWPAAGGFGEEKPQLIFLNVDDPRLVGAKPEPEPTDLTEAARKRRRLADKLASGLSKYPYDDPRSHELVATLALPAAVRYVPVLQKALVDAPDVAQQSDPGAVKVTSGNGGVVIRLHAQTWSLVFRFLPVAEPVLLVTDEQPKLARRVDTDQDWEPEVRAALTAVVGELSRFSLGGDRYRPPRWLTDE
jgi:hypothetical protein